MAAKPKNYTVTITREIRHVAIVEMTAIDEEQAITRARALVDSPVGGYWVEGDVIDETVTVRTDR